MADEMESLKADIHLIQERNIRVEAEKAWEGSIVRVASIAAVTYCVACAALYVIGNEHPLRNALIPTIGYVLSTWSLPFLKHAWIRRHMQNIH